MSLNGGNGNHTYDIVSRTTTGKIIDRTCDALKEGTVSLGATEALYELIADIARFKRWEDEDVGVAGNLGIGGFELRYFRNDCCVELEIAVKCQLRSFLVGKFCCLLDLLGSFSSGRAHGGVGEHGHARLLIHESAPRLRGCEGNFGKLIGVGIDVEAAVGKEERTVFAKLRFVRAHNEERGNKLGSRSGLDDLERRSERVGGGVAGAGNKAVGIAHLDHHGGKIGIVVHGFASLLNGDAFACAQLGKFLRISFMTLIGGRAYNGCTGNVNLIRISKDYKICKVFGDDDLCGRNGAGIFTFGKHDGFFISLSGCFHLFKKLSHEKNSYQKGNLCHTNLIIGVRDKIRNEKYCHRKALLAKRRRFMEVYMAIMHGLPAGFNPDAYDVMVVGAGYAGSVVARRMAEACNFKVAIIERRGHIAGNAYDRIDDAGVLIHEYGPHIYHTVSDRVHEFLSRFTEWTNYQHKVRANIYGQLMPVPFNHASLKLAFGEERGEKLYQKLVSVFGENVKVPIMELREQNDPELEEIADYVYENVFLHYTMKQWGKTPDQIDKSITGRVPVFVGDDDRYFPTAKYQGMPAEGYTKLFENMLDHDLIDVFLDVDVRDIMKIDASHVSVCDKPFTGEVIYTGPLDELFGLDLGALPYRTLDMQFETLDQDQFQPVGTVNYTVSEDFTRITEFKNMTGQVVPGKTTIMREYSHAYEPGSGQTPYYAILEPESQELYRTYRERVADVLNFHPVGRLAEYRYYDMDGVVASALELSDELIANQA